MLENKREVIAFLRRCPAVCHLVPVTRLQRGVGLADPWNRPDGTRENGRPKRDCAYLYPATEVFFDFETPYRPFRNISERKQIQLNVTFLGRACSPTASITVREATCG